MSELIETGIPIKLDTVIVKANDGIEKKEYIKRNLVFNYNVIKKCIGRFGSLDDVLNGITYDNVLWIAEQMLIEDAKIHNRAYPDDPIPVLTEDEIGMYIMGINGLTDLIKKVNEAMILGLHPDQVQAVEEIEKNLKTTQGQNGKMKHLLKRFLPKGK